MKETVDSVVAIASRENPKYFGAVIRLKYANGSVEYETTIHLSS
jgi:hypothetical protein